MIISSICRSDFPYKPSQNWGTPLMEPPKSWFNDLDDVGVPALKETFHITLICQANQEVKMWGDNRYCTVIRFVYNNNLRYIIILYYIEVSENMGTPSSLDGLFHGKSANPIESDDLGPLIFH